MNRLRRLQAVYAHLGISVPEEFFEDMLTEIEPPAAPDLSSPEPVLSPFWDDYHFFFDTPAEWVYPGDEVEIQEFTIDAGMLYVGYAHYGTSLQREPSLIQPSQPARRRRAKLGSKDFSGWLSYEGMAPTVRGAYLAWHEGGRLRTDVPLEFPTLFFLGLERRVLVDIIVDDGLDDELPMIRDTVVDLLARFPSPGYQTLGLAGPRLLGLIDILLDPGALDQTAPAPRNPARREAPNELRLRLSAHATERVPIGADLAFAWAWHRPVEIAQTMPLKRCPEEFERLFAIHFDRAHPGGRKLPRSGRQVVIQHTAANSSVRKVEARMPNTVDVFRHPNAIRSLAKIWDQTTIDLDPYARWLGRAGAAPDSLAALAHLPTALVADDAPPIVRLRGWVADRLGSRPAAQVPGAELIALWSGPDAAKPTKPDAVALAAYLAGFNLGIEPDPRFGGPALSADTGAVVFQTTADAPAAPTESYATATILLRLATAVGLADGGLSATEARLLGRRLRSAFGITAPEMQRLSAHLTWLPTTSLKLASVQHHARNLPIDVRQTIGEILIAVALADGTAGPSELAMLAKTYRTLGLDDALVSSHIHALLSGSGTASAARDPAATGGPIALDPAAIERKQAESADVGALLAGLFTDDDLAATPAQGEPAPSVPNGASPPALAPAIGPLGAAHAAMLAAVVERSTWSRADFAALAAQHHLLPDGAIDVLNEAAYDACGEPLIEGDDELTINAYAIETMLG